MAGSAADPALWARAQSGDRHARAQLVLRHIGLARAIAARFGEAGPGREDLAQAAALGLVEAVAAYDPSRGVAFSTYAVPRILGAVRDTLRQSSGLSGGRPLAREAAALRRAEALLRNRLGREPGTAELARALAWSPIRLAEVAAALEPMTPLGPTGAWPGADATSPEGRVVERLALQAALGALPEAERRLIALRYMGRLSQTEVAAIMGIGQSQVSRRERRALVHLWRALGDRGAMHGRRGHEAT